MDSSRYSGVQFGLLDTNRIGVTTYRHSSAAKYPVIIGFAFPLFYYVTMGVGAFSTAGVGVVFVPIENLVLVFIGWRVGRYFDYEE